MGGSFDRVRDHGRNFFTNWSDSDAPFAKKLGFTVRNRVKALRRGCCGSPGQPGC